MDIIHTLMRKAIHRTGKLLRSIHIQYLRSTGVEIGKNCMISLRAKIDVRRGSVTIGDRCTVTYGSVILSHDGSARQIDAKDSGDGRVVLEEGVFVGVNSVILRNVTIGKNSVIGAGSVVTTDIPPMVVAAGNPAKIIKRINPDRI